MAGALRHGFISAFPMVLEGGAWVRILPLQETKAQLTLQEREGERDRVRERLSFDDALKIPGLGGTRGAPHRVPMATQYVLPSPSGLGDPHSPRLPRKETIDPIVQAVPESRL